MPKPGPRPYECVKRAWHSDRNHPIRGSIIRQVFRLAMGTHSVETRKNKEWQEKLPLVVLKAEEIMYSKANSEEEYTDAETMWNRVNDAINTVIRRDESLEAGPLLPPCVEAALNLGCIAVRASRSQRHSNIRTYLGPQIHVSESTSKPPYDHHEAQKLVSSPAPALVNLGSVCSLNYGGNNQTQEVDMFGVPEVAMINGKPIGIKSSEEERKNMCDLSLRLGMSSELA